ncbi:hypothetical protein [Anaerotruncus rubiinfantis]|uniref:hypothetical protein n=1 Tax=Anaerotruncus rubiinfantis TaxID=1720200 RepID=UPI0018979833|nr:hypothetical protein [Anaerotruncus rubiinfantis]
MADFKKYDYAQSKDILPRKQSTIQWGGKTDDLTNLPFKNTRAADDYLVNQGFMRQEANRPVLSAPSGNSVLPIKKPTALERADSFIKSTGSGAMNAVSGIFDYMGNLPVKTAQERVSARDDYFRMWEQAKANPALLRDKEFQSRLLQAQLTASSGYNWMDDTLAQFDPTASSTASQMLQEQQAKSTQKLKEGMSPAASAVTDVALAGTDMALKFGLSSAMGVPFLAFMGADSGAQAGQNALNEGYSANQSATMAAGAGAITAGAESFGGIAGKWGDKLIGALVKSPAGKAIAGKLPANVVEYISKLSASKVGQIAGDALSEGAEEFTEYGAQLFLENLVLDKDTPYDIKQALYNAGIGGAVGGLFGGGRVFAQDILPHADTQNSANASSDIASGMKPEYNQGGGGLNANDTGRAAGSQIQNDRGLHGREDGSGAFGEEISGIQENQRTNAEPAGTFIARATQEGKVVEADDFGNIVSYKPAQMVTGNAAEAQEILKRRGLDCFVYEGTLARNKNGMTVEHLTDAQTLADGRIGIKGDCTLPGVEIAGHEGFHSITITNPEIAETFLQNISLAPAGKSIAYQETYDAVGLAMYGDKYSPTNSTQRNNILKELGAQIGGKMDSDLELARELFSDMLDDFDATYELWKKVNADFDALKSGRSGAASGYGQNTVGAAESGGRMTNAQLVEKYGALRKGEAPRAREIDLAAETREGKTSRFAQNAAESAALGAQAEAIEQEVASGTFAYVPIADQSAVDTASGRISQYGYEQTLNDFDSLLRSDKRIGKNDIALGELLIQEAAKRGDTDTVVKLVADVAALGTEMGQNVQALRILKRLSPEGRLMASQRMVQRINEQHRGKKGWKDVTIPKENVQDLLSQTTPDGMDAANDRILRAVADQMPSSWVDKWNAWRYLAMLGNVRTQGRNLAGNTVFVPARKFKNLIAAGLESALPMKERSKAILNRRAAGDRALIEFAKGDYANVRDAILGTGKMNAASQLDQKRTIFKNNGDWGTRADDGVLPRKVRAATDKLWSGVEGYRKLTDWAMDQGDAIFAKSAYAESLASYMKANGLKPADMVNQFGGETQAAVQARNYAVLEAQKATYRDASKVATALSKFSRTNKATALLTEGILPFKKTPMNVLKRGYEYSPVSFLTTFTKGAYDLKTGKITATEWIDRLASGLSGTGILALGWALTKLGILTGGALEDKKEQELNELQGVQNYSVVLPGDIYYDVSWMAPVSIPLFIGSEIANMQEREGREIGITEFMDAANKLAEPMLEMSMLDGLQSTIQAAGYSGNALGAMTGNAVGSYFGQAIPTIFGQAARTIDPVRRGVYVDKNEDMPAAFQRFFQSNIKAKLPFANQSLQPRLDAWGRESAPKSLPLRAFENFVSPGYISIGQTAPADKAVTDLYAATGENSILPSKVSKYVTVDGEKINYTGDQYTQIQRKRGQSANELIAKLAELPVYQELDNAGKVDAMEDIYKYTRQMAIADVIPEYKPDTWVTDAYEAEKSGLELASYLAWRASYGELKPDKDRNGKTTYSASDKFRDLLYADDSLTAAQKARIEQDFTGADNPRDYSSGNAFVLSGLTDSQQEKYSGRLAKTLTPQEYAKALKAMGGSVRDKKTGKARQKNRQEKIDSLVAAGYSRQRATQIYNLVK